MHFRFSFTRWVDFSKSLFFGVLCVLRVLRDSDGYFCQNLRKPEDVENAEGDFGDFSLFSQLSGVL